MLFGWVRPQRVPPQVAPDFATGEAPLVADCQPSHRGQSCRRADWAAELTLMLHTATQQHMPVPMPSACITTLMQYPEGNRRHSAGARAVAQQQRRNAHMNAEDANPS
jgi:hypothetical protein